MIKRVNITRL